MLACREDTQSMRDMERERKRESDNLTFVVERGGMRERREKERERQSHFCSGESGNEREERKGECRKLCWVAAFIPNKAFNNCRRHNGAHDSSLYSETWTSGSPAAHTTEIQRDPL